MEESKQQRCQREAWKYPYMRRRKFGAPRKTFRSTRISDGRESKKKQRDQKRPRKNAMNTMSLCVRRRSDPHHPRKFEISCKLPSSCKLPLIMSAVESPARRIGTHARLVLHRTATARRRNAKERSTLRYGISTSLPVDCRDSMNLCASAACANGNDLPTSSLSLPSAINLNDSSIPRRIKSGCPATV